MDNGQGIGEEKLIHIFDRFYQVDNSSKRTFEGSGIGLSLVKELVELHGGKITVSSRINKGTSFSCLLPFNKKIQSGEFISTHIKNPMFVMPVMEDGEEIFLPDNDLSKSKSPILIVEDNEDVRQYIYEKLTGHYAILQAKNGVEGLQIATEQIPDLVISDVMMPEMDGFELCKALKTDVRTSHIPVILLTARAEDKDKMRGLETGADAYVVKPFNSQELLIRVNNLITIRNILRKAFSNKLVVKPSDITVTSRDRTFMQKLLTTVENHIADSQFSVVMLGNEMAMSASQINRKIKAIIDQSAQQFIRSARMQRAMELLKKESSTISETAWQVGFEDPGYFTKVFKKYFGCLPTEKEKFPE